MALELARQLVRNEMQRHKKVLADQHAREMHEANARMEQWVKDKEALNKRIEANNEKRQKVTESLQEERDRDVLDEMELEIQRQDLDASLAEQLQQEERAITTSDVPVKRKPRPRPKRVVGKGT